MHSIFFNSFTKFLSNNNFLLSFEFRNTDCGSWMGSHEIHFLYLSYLYFTYIHFNDSFYLFERHRGKCKIFHLLLDSMCYFSVWDWVNLRSGTQGLQHGRQELKYFRHHLCFPSTVAGNWSSQKAEQHCLWMWASSEATYLHLKVCPWSLALTFVCATERTYLLHNKL